MDETKENRFLPIPEYDELSQSTKSKNVVKNPRKHFIFKGKGRAKKMITYYETNNNTPFCMNAVTNWAYTAKYGSKEEDRLFSVILATGVTGQTPPVLFYDSPEEYERHFETKVSNETKQRWNKKRLQYQVSKIV